MPAVGVEALVKRYPKSSVNAVDGISFSVEAGEVFGLLGPNGAGKTTTVGMLTTRVRPSGGRATVGGVDVMGDPVTARSKLAVVPHLASRGFSEDPKALEPATRKVSEALETLAAEKITDPARIAQAARRAVGKWVAEVYRRQPMIVPTVIEI